RWQRIDVAGRRRLWFALSVVAVALSFGAIFGKGLNLGIDFKGGVQVSFTTPQATSLATVRTQITQKGSVVQGTGKSFGGDKYKAFQIRLKKLGPANQDKLTADLQTKLHAQKLGV